mgnify:CR=1 FL=1
MREFNYNKAEKEIVNCNCCGSDNFHKVLDIDRFNMGVQTVICNDCGLVFLNPVLSEDELHQFYSQHYRKFYERLETPNDEYIKQNFLFEKAELVKEFLEDHLKPKSSILDVGASEGIILHSIEKTLKQKYPKGSYKTVGIDPNEKFVAYGNENFKTNILSQRLMEYVNNSKDQFDIIILHHVLEHFRDPTQALLKIKNLLNEDGVLFVEVPNIEYQRITKDFFHLAHLYYFSPSTLAHLFKKCGFGVVKKDLAGNQYHPWSMRYLFGKMDKQTETGAKLKFRKDTSNLRTKFLSIKIIDLLSKNLKIETKHLLDFKISNSSYKSQANTNINALLQVVNELGIQLKLATSSVVTLQNEVQSKKSLLAEHQQYKKELLAKLQDKNQEIIRKKALIEEKRIENASLVKLLDEKRNDIKEKIALIEQKRTENINLKKLLNEKNINLKLPPDILSNSQKELEVKQKLIDISKQEISELKRVLTEKIDKVNELELKVEQAEIKMLERLKLIEKFRITVQSLEDRLLEKNKLLEIHIQDIENLKADKERLDSKIRNLDDENIKKSKELERKTTTLNQELKEKSSLKAELEEQIILIKQQQEKINSLNHERIKSKEEHDEFVTILNQQIDDLELKLSKTMGYKLKRFFSSVIKKAKPHN